MANVKTLVSATIVGFLLSLVVNASPLESVEVPPTDKEPSGATSHELNENLSVSPPPEVDQEIAPPAPPRYYSARQALSLRFGQTDDQFIWGGQFQFPKFLSPKLEAGADALEDGNGHIHIGWRWIMRERKYFRYSYKASLDHLLEPENGLGTLASLDNYFARVSGAIEYTFWNPYSLRLEAEALSNIDFDFEPWLLVALMRGW